MKIILNDKSGVILKTANKHCKEDIEVSVETEELTITPSIEEQVNEGLYNKITVQAMENVAPLLSVQDDHINAQIELLAIIKMELIRKGYIKENGGV